MESKTIIEKVRKAKEIKKINKNGLPSPKNVECSVCEKIFLLNSLSHKEIIAKRTIWSIEAETKEIHEYVTLSQKTLLQ